MRKKHHYNRYKDNAKLGLLVLAVVGIALAIREALEWLGK